MTSIKTNTLYIKILHETNLLLISLTNRCDKFTSGYIVLITKDLQKCDTCNSLYNKLCDHQLIPLMQKRRERYFSHLQQKLGHINVIVISKQIIFHLVWRKWQHYELYCVYSSCCKKSCCKQLVFIILSNTISNK